MKNYYNTAIFPTELHQQTAEVIKDFFLDYPIVDTFLVVNSCARGQASPESDLDFAVLISSDTLPAQIQQLELNWQSFANTNTHILSYKKSHPFLQVHVDVIDGKY